MQTPAGPNRGRRHHRPPGLGQGFFELAGIALEALKFRPPNYIKSFFGPYRGWVPPYRENSEFHIVNVWRPWITAKWLVNATVPSMPREPLKVLPPLVEEVLWQPTRIYQDPDERGDYTTYPRERWFFINGILTNTDLAQFNSDCITALFHRPVTLIQNSTDGVVLDLLECALGKEWRINTESATVGFPAIYDALKDPGKDRVVVICHSQGTIIMAVILQGLKYLARRQEWGPNDSENHEEDFTLGALEDLVSSDLRLDMSEFEDLTNEEMGKLEIYAFANCATRMRYHIRPTEYAPIPWIENFGNEFDFVARLGMLAPDAYHQGIRISGPSYARWHAWGHLLNECYLFPIADEQQKGNRRGGAGGPAPFSLLNGYRYPWAGAPRLYGYINGGTPPPYAGMTLAQGEDFGQQAEPVWDEEI